ncbi:aromatic ring-hydroxylating oxygenase subunit alpha [Methylobrevis albus]|uniref:Aromatic ring-hydroxylating dioxygenase subunit alpha n=1 Tax=Methylobrevis albus TaxID=2793297 RepID=A0A931I066_9HYPH|nr:aromatic ring-hydroxylating dioxygenase subunit alpha [Methylobrevis albus]MBH0237705.1 aromatic ring-hydroxylating dioxygenase subunit alpha [Methylobrevis albus]
MAVRRARDRVALDLWQVIGAVEDVPATGAATTVLMEETLAVSRGPAGIAVHLPETGEALPVLLRYGYVWTSLGTPPAELFPLPEWAEPDRRNLNAGTVGVHVSAPRAIENFLDMAHFPYVHTGILGAEPHTEVEDYDVEVSDSRDEVLATRCRFWQPMAATTATGAIMADYVYRVPHPYCAVLYKTCPAEPHRRDVIGILLQPVSEERVRAHLMLSLIDHDNPDTVLRRFQQTIFGQDKPILENQVPKKLPLDPRAETPIRADKSAVAYRRWLRQKGLTYGTIPAAA